RQPTAHLQRLAVAGEDGDAVPRGLAMVQATIARRLQGLAGEVLVSGLELLQAGDVGLFARQPGEQPGQAAADAVEVEGGDLQCLHASGSSTWACTASVRARAWAWSARALSASQSSQSMAPSSRRASAVRINS